MDFGAAITTRSQGTLCTLALAEEEDARYHGYICVCVCVPCVCALVCLCVCLSGWLEQCGGAGMHSSVCVCGGVCVCVCVCVCV